MSFEHFDHDDCDRLQSQLDKTREMERAAKRSEWAALDHIVQLEDLLERNGIEVPERPEECK